MVDHKGHPLPCSEEARHGEIPEHAERDKGCGDDPAPLNQPAGEAVTPEGKRYDVAREHRASHGAALSGRQRGTGSGGELERDQAEHQDRGQSIAAAELDRD